MCCVVFYNKWFRHSFGHNCTWYCFERYCTKIVWKVQRLLRNLLAIPPIEPIFPTPRLMPDIRPITFEVAFCRRDTTSALALPDPAELPMLKFAEEPFWLVSVLVSLFRGGKKYKNRINQTEKNRNQRGGRE